MLFLSRFFVRRRRGSGGRKAGAIRAGLRRCRLLPQLLLAFTLLTGTVACGASRDDNGSNGGSDPDPPDPPDEESLLFVPEGTLALAPSELATLTVEVSPRRRQNVTFELLTETQGFDGFLLESEVRVGDDGMATVELRAPSGPALFTVRASLPEGSRAVRAISVSAQGFASVDVIPLYDGARSIAQWTASARVGETCESLETYFEDGQLAATGASKATITDVPSGVPVAITIRGGQLAAGCATVTPLRAGDLTEVEIEVNDRPIDVNNGTLAVQLGIDSSTTIFASHISEAVVTGSGYFQARSASEADALLAAMSSNLSAAKQEDFEAAISAYELADVVHDVYVQATNEAGAPIARVISTILNDAASQIAGPDVFRGELTLEGASSQFHLTEVVGVEASVSGFFQGSTWMASAESGDMVVLGGTLSYEPLRWLGAIADHRSEEGGSPSARIAEAARCPAIADAIFTAVGGPPYAACDALCLSELCDESVANVWEELVTQGPALTTLQLGISGRASLFGSARIEALTGTWVGRLGTEDETSVGGTAEAELLLEE